MWSGRILLILLPVAIVLACSPRQFGINRMAAALSSTADAYVKDDDPEFVKAAVPFSLKLMESLLAENPKHQGLLLHSVYHRPNGWDYVAPGQKVPNGESSMWGDYHARELALLLLREARRECYPTFFA